MSNKLKEVARFKKDLRKKFYVDINLLTIILSSILIGSVTILTVNIFFGIGFLSFLLVNQVMILIFLFWIVNYLYKWLP